ncbi:thiamine-phosphate kinase [Halobacillus sp. Marseille-Q1614]|uniref:thiamine-phosphate kinase n=1 Tax=Halobacillus sp. Marseille-Q1614 TaxID=2709134 RepID=UPI00156FD863|nr:thiamine-phosphate kinase [Halobacillus sp. Marseille-Q1614]
MDEFSFIDSIQPRTYRQSSLIKGISDDAAVFRQTSQDIVTAVDTMVEDVHFSKKTMDPYHVGYRALAANLSDLAAMGSTPAYYLVSLVVPPHWSEEELQELYRGMMSLANEYRMDLIGGDTVSGKELCVSVTVIGFTAKGKARYRRDAREGDIVFVTGTLGDARAGLECLLKEKPSEYLIRRHRTPDPRIRFAKRLEELPRVSLNDVSDGIASESNEIAEEARVDLHLDFAKLPYAKESQELFPYHYEDWILAGGEDFELLGTVSEKDWSFVQNAAEKENLKVTRIGWCEAAAQSNGQVYLYKNNQRRLLEKSGYTHLQEDRD